MKSIISKIILLTATLLITVSALPLAAQQTWESQALAYANENPENVGLRHLAQGLSAIQVTNTNDELDKIIKNGWTEKNQLTMQALEKNRAALKSLYLAGSMENTKIPPVKASDNFADVLLPNFLSAQLATKLTLCNARLLESQGNLEQAVDLTLHAAWVSTFFCDEDQTLITQLVGIAGQKYSLIVLQSLLKNPNLDKEVIQETGSHLYKIEQRRKSIYHALEVESRFKEGALRTGFEQVQSQKKALSAEELAKFPEDKRELFNQMLSMDIDEVLAENEKLWNLILTNAKKGYWERDDFAEGWSAKQTDNPFIAMSLPNYTEGTVRDEVVLARLRICQLICALRLGRENLADNFPDPFTGKPLSRNGNIVYSLGPDMQDQKGLVIYDPTNGTISSGDVGVTP